MSYQESLHPWAVYFYPAGDIFGVKVMRRCRTRSDALGFKQSCSHLLDGELIILFDPPELGLKPINV